MGNTQHNLTDREITIIRLVSQGKKNKEIAAVVGLARHTLDNTMTNLYRRFGIRDGAKRVKLASVYSRIIRGA